MLGKKNASYQYLLIYKSPRTCRLKAEELIVDKKQLTLKFYEASAGFCDKLYKGKISITIENKNKMSALIESISKKLKKPLS